MWTTVRDISKSILYGVSESAKSYGEYKLLRITDIQNNLVEWNSVPYTDFDTKKANAYLLKDGDILFARTGATVGKSYIVQGLKEKSIYASYLIRVQTFDVILPQYVKFFFESGYYWEQIEQESVGVGQPNVNGTVLGNLQIPIPPIQEQIRISTELTNWFNIIDLLEQDKIELNSYILQAKSKVLDLAIQGKLVTQDPTDEPAVELLKRINPNFTPCDNSHYENVPFEIPQSWKWIKLNIVCSIARGGSPRPIKEYLTNSEDAINWIKIGDTDKDGKYINSTKEKIIPEGIRKSRMVHKGDFLLTNSMSFGRPYILNIDGCIHDGWLVISPMKDTYDTEFLYYLLSSRFAYDQFTEVASGGVVSNLNSEKVANSYFPILPISEQKRIADKITQIWSMIDTITAEL